MLDVHRSSVVSLAERVQIQMHMAPGFWHPLPWLSNTLLVPVDVLAPVCADLAAKGLIEQREVESGLQYGRWTHSTSAVVRGAGEEAA